jgi:hypothetical protein
MEMIMNMMNKTRMLVALTALGLPLAAESLYGTARAADNGPFDGSIFNKVDQNGRPYYTQGFGLCSMRCTAMSQYVVGVELSQNKKNPFLTDAIPTFDYVWLCQVFGPDGLLYDTDDPTEGADRARNDDQCAARGDLTN